MNTLLSAACECLQNSESSRTTVRQIANVAGVNQAMINYYFEGKDGLLSSLYERDFQDLKRKLNRLRKAIDADQDESISIESLMILIENHFEARKGLFLLTRGDVMYEGSTLYQVYMQRMANRAFSSIVRIIEALMRKGKCRSDLSPDHVAYIMSSAIALQFMLGPIFAKVFNATADSEDRESRRHSVARLLTATGA